MLNANGFQIRNTLNTEINNKIMVKKTPQNWHSFLRTLNHSTTTNHLYKTINSITNSNSGITHIQSSHTAITTTTIPSEKQHHHRALRKPKSQKRGKKYYKMKTKLPTQHHHCIIHSHTNNKNHQKLAVHSTLTTSPIYI